MHGHVIDADVADQSHADQQGDAAGTSIADEGGGQTSRGEESADDADIDKCLERNENADALTDQHADAVDAQSGDAEEADHEQCVKNHDNEDTGQTEFLSQNSDDEIRMRLRKVVVLHDAFHEAAAPHAAAAQGHFGQLELVS